MKRFAGKKGVELPKKKKRLKGSRKDCKINSQARCEEKLFTDKSLSLFALQKKIVT